MNNTIPAFRFNKTGFFFIGLLVIALIGFWPTYFAKFFNGTGGVTTYMHIHAFFATCWIILLIVQPILIQKKRHRIHRRLGTLSYFLIPLIFLTVLLLAHSRITGSEDEYVRNLWIPFKDLIIISVGFFVAIRFRKNPSIHARGMIATGIAFIEPALVRVLMNNFFQDSPQMGYIITILLVYSILLSLIVAERKQKQGRWVFPLILFLLICVHAVIFLQIELPPFRAFAKWFAGLPLT